MRIIRWLLLCALAALAPPAGPAPVQAAGAAPVAVGGDAATEAAETVISTEICSGLFLVPLVWTSERSGRAHRLLAVFDTGGSSVLIDPDSLQRASGQRVESGKRVRMRNVTVAGRAFTVLRPRVRDLDHLSRALGRPLDVFLPFKTFDEHLLTLDYPRGEMRISKGTLPGPDGVEIFSARGRDRRPWLKVRIGPERRALLLDSGSNGSISVSPESGLEWRSPPLLLKYSHGMDGYELSPVGRMAGTLVVGSLSFRDPLVAVTRGTELLGSEILRHFVLTFDQKRQRVRMRPVTGGPVPMDPLRGTGAVFRAVREGLEVAHVLEGSPAERAGLRKGDVVTHRDGVSLVSEDCYREHRAGEDSVRFTVRRGDATLELAVPVEVLIP